MGEILVNDNEKMYSEDVVKDLKVKIASLESENNVLKQKIDKLKQHFRTELAKKYATTWEYLLSIVLDVAKEGQIAQFSK